MRIHIVNPNTTRAFTDKIAKAAATVKLPDTELVVTQAGMGPVSIEGYYDEAFAVPGLLAEVRKADMAGVAGHVIACFDDTGLDAARCIATAPVVGIGEAGFHAASMIAGKFSVVTTLSRSIPAIEHNLVRYGLMSRCGKVRASEVPVLELEEARPEAIALISEEIMRAKQDDRAEAIVLGCAGMADLAAALERQHGLPVIDGVAAAVGLIEALARLGLKTSKLGGYAAPRPKTYTGIFSSFAP
jgi:allantoin racemase